MRNSLIKTRAIRKKRAWRVRNKIQGSSIRPRLCVIKSNKHIQAHLVDDENDHTLCGVATYSKEFRNTDFGKKSVEAAKKLGESIAKMAKEKDIKTVVFDRGPFKYHGILAALADAAREHGLIF